MEINIKELGLLILNVILSSIVVLATQSFFISKYEQNNLVQSLIPSLTSDDPREINTALLILKESVSKEKYEAINKIIDQRVVSDAKSIGRELPERVGATTSNATPIRHRTKMNFENELNQDRLKKYAEVRPEWKIQVIDGIYSTLKPITKKEFLDSLNEYSSSVDPYLKDLVRSSAKAVNNGQCLRGWVGSLWLVKIKNNQVKNDLWLGLSKSCSKVEAEKMIKFYLADGLNVLDRELEETSFLNNPSQTLGNKVDDKDQTILQIVQGKANDLDLIINPPKKEPNPLYNEQ